MAVNPQETANLLTEAIRTLRLSWRLLRDRRVPLWAKAIPVAAVMYILFPLDLLVDPILGLGKLDDLAIAILGVKLFIAVCPAEVVREHREAIEGVVEASYRVVSEEEGSERPSPDMLEGGY